MLFFIFYSISMITNNEPGETRESVKIRWPYEQAEPCKTNETSEPRDTSEPCKPINPSETFEPPSSVSKSKKPL